MLEIKHDQSGAVTVIAFIGSLDALTAPKLGEAFTQALGEGKARLVADLTGLEYTSSAGLRVLLAAVKDARQKGGDLRLAGVQANVSKVFEMSGFPSIIKMFPDVAGAVESFG